MDLEIAGERVKSTEPVELDVEAEIPLPDYPDEGENQTDGGHESCFTSISNDAELIAPKKLINPCLLSKDHKALRQELKFNQKLGKNPMEKPELIKVLKDRQEKEKKKEMEEHQKSKRSSFDIRLEQQAQKITQAEHLQLQQSKGEDEKPEFFKIHSKIIQAKSNS